MSPTDDKGAARDPQADQRAIPLLISQLSDRDGLKRQAARVELVEIGAAAVPALVAALDSAAEHARWEATKALTELPHAQAAAPLVERLRRDADSIRWLAGTALINIGEEAFAPIVQALLADPANARLRDGARRVLTDFQRRWPDHPHLPALLDALRGQAQTETIPWVARRVLKELGIIQSDAGAP